MSPEVSRAAAQAKARLGLDADDPRYLELIQAAEQARTVDDLPEWVAREQLR